MTWVWLNSAHLIWISITMAVSFYKKVIEINFNRFYCINFEALKKKSEFPFLYFNFISDFLCLTLYNLFYEKSLFYRFHEHEQTWKYVILYTRHCSQPSKYVYIIICYAQPLFVDKYYHDVIRKLLSLYTPEVS